MKTENIGRMNNLQFTVILMSLQNSFAVLTGCLGGAQVKICSVSLDNLVISPVQYK